MLAASSETDFLRHIDTVAESLIMRLCTIDNDSKRRFTQLRSRSVPAFLCVVTLYSLQLGLPSSKKTVHNACIDFENRSCNVYLKSCICIV